MATAQVTARLSADASNFKSVMNDAEKHTGKIAAGITKKFELRNIGQTMATALGLNLQNMSLAVARFATGMSSELEAAYGKVIAASDRARDAVIANMRAQATDENKAKLLLDERAKLQARLDAGRANGADLDGKPSLMSRFRASIISGPWLYDKGKSMTEEGNVLNKKALDEYVTRIAQIETELRALDGKRKKPTDEGTDPHKEWIAGLHEGVIATNEATNAEEKRLEVAEQITEEIVQQVEELEEVKKQTIEITRIGREDAELSDRELERKVKNLRQGIDATSRSQIGDPNIARYLNQPAELELARLKGEIDLRNKVRMTANRFGEDKAFQMFNLSESRFAEILRGQTENTEQTKLLRSLNDKLERGIRVRSIATPGSQTAEE